MKPNRQKFLIFILSCLILTTASLDPIPFKQTDIVGKYSVVQLYNQLPKAKIQVQIAAAYVKISGCSVSSANYVYDLSSKIFTVDRFVSNAGNCQIDQDAIVSKSIKQTKKMYRVGSQVVCQDGQGTVILRLQIPNTISSFNINSSSSPPAVTATAGNQIITVQRKIQTVQTVTITVKSILGSVLTPVPQLTASMIPVTPMPSDNINTNINPNTNINGNTNSGNVSPTDTNTNTGVTDWLNARSIIGDYQYTVPALGLKADKNIYALQGCNIHTFQYTTNSTEKNSAKFRIIGSTKRACDVDFDSFYLQAFALTRFMVPIDNGFRLLDENSKLIMQILNDPSSQQTGSYLLNLPSVTLTIDEQFFSFEGCNINSIAYKQTTKSQLQFNEVTSTRRFCLFFDYDQLIIQSLQLANKYEWSKKALMFKNSNDVVTGFAVPSLPLPLPIKTAPIVVSPANPAPSTVLPVVTIPTSTSQSTSTSSTSAPTSSVTPSTLQLPPSSSSSASSASSTQQIPSLPSFPFIIPPQLYSLSTSPTQLPPLFIPTHYSQPVSPSDPQSTPIPNNIILPNCQPTSLRGTYRFQSVQTSLPPLYFNFEDQYVGFQGCNLWRIPYTVFTDGLFAILDGGSSTKRTCIIDQDNEYIQILKTANRFKKTDTGYTLLQFQRPLCNLQLKIRNSVVKYNIINGGYQIQLPGLDATVSDTAISFTGCNVVTIPYKLSANGDVQLGASVSTLMACDKNLDSYYLNAIKKAKKVKQINEGFVFVDDKGTELIKFVGFFDTNQKSKFFIGKFKLQLPNGGYRLKISDGVFTLEGCNQFDFKFSLADSGAIVFSNPSSTKTTCQIDNDNVFLTSILKSQNIIVNDRTIILNNGNNQQMAKIINYDKNTNNNNSTVTIIDPKSPIIKITQSKLLDSTYTFTLLRSTLKKLNLKIASKNISFKGCNTINMAYIAASDGTIKFTNGPATQIYCRDDYDDFYYKALLSAIKYTQMKGMYTFYDNKGQSVATFTLIQADTISAPVVSAVNTPNLQGSIQTVVNIPANQNTYIAPSTVVPTPMTTTTQTTTTTTSTSTVTQISSTPSPTQTQTQTTTSITPSTTTPSTTTSTSTPITIPPITTLPGKYKLTLPQFNLQVLDNSLIYRGCNTYRYPCIFKANKVFISKPIVTNKNCQNDSNNQTDQYVISRIPLIYTYKRDNNTFTFFNTKLQSLFVANLTTQSPAQPAAVSNSPQSSTSAQVIAPSAVPASSVSSLSSPLSSPTVTSTPVSVPTSQLKPGSYKAQLPSIDAIINDTSINFKGCKGDGILYRVEKDGKFTYFDSNKTMLCSAVQNPIYQNSVKDATKIRKIDKGYELIDQDGNSKAYFIPSDY